jgi:hypothetical protein
VKALIKKKKEKENVLTYLELINLKKCISIVKKLTRKITEAERK